MEEEQRRERRKQFPLIFPPAETFLDSSFRGCNVINFAVSDRVPRRRGERKEKGRGRKQGVETWQRQDGHLDVVLIGPNFLES